MTLREDGAVTSRVPSRGYDVSRRSYDFMDPAGRALFLVDAAGEGGSAPRSWPVIGNIAGERAEPSRVERVGDCLRISNTENGLRTTIEITLPGTDERAELWTITVENPSSVARAIKVVPYLEWVLNNPDADRNHTQYNRLFAEIEYVSTLQGMLAWDKHSRAMGLLASDRRRRGSCHHGSISSAAVGGSGRPGCWRHWRFRRRWTSSRTRRLTRSAVCSSA